MPQVLHRLHVGRLKRRHRLEVDGANQVRAILEQKEGNGLTLDLSIIIHRNRIDLININRLGYLAPSGLLNGPVYRGTAQCRRLTG